MTVIGVLGAGQLGRMLALAGYRLGLEFRFFDTTPEACAGQVGHLTVGDFADEEALTRFAESVDIMTLEWENVPLAAANLLTGRLPFYPPPRSLELSQDRLVEKTTLRGLGIPTAPFAAVETLEELEIVSDLIGFPGVLKTRRGGYDGRGQAVVHSVEEARFFLAATPQPLIYEGFVNFERELSIIAVRSTTGAIRFYPLVENHHRDGILRLTRAPAPELTPELRSQAEAIARRLLDELQYVGVLSIELFQDGDDLLVNEIAPRVHNSGHWTIDGAATSQFENHVRALCGLPLGDCSAQGVSAMVNLIGDHPPLDQMLAIPGVNVHLYDKSPRPGRKLGHVNICSGSKEDLEETLTEIMSLVQAHEA